MNKFLKFVCIFLIIINFFFASWYVLHKDIIFLSDVSRDFLLLQELDQKKLILTGERASGNLFHGPLWLYLSYPGYILGHGNPVVEGWYWIFLIACFIFSSYFIAKKLFDIKTAWLFVLMTSLYSVYISNAMFHPHAAMFLLPFYFFFFIRYVQTQKLSFLLIHVFLAGCLIQFEIAIGTPFFLLSCLAILILTIKTKKYTHLFSLLIVLIPLSTFILFDLRHHFLLTYNAIRHLGTKDFHQNFLNLIFDRVRIWFLGVEFLRFSFSNNNLYVFIIFLFFLFSQIKNNKHRVIYLWFLYFYTGYFILSLFNRYALLYFYIYPLFTFVFLIFCSFISSKYNKAFFIIFSLIYILNVIAAVNYIQDSKNFIGKSQLSWNFLINMVNHVYDKKDKEIGYFVYAPDVIAYAPKYAISYAASNHRNTKSYSFQKKPVTYLIIAPPPQNNPFMKDAWWKQHQINIYGSPDATINFQNGYKIERYKLTDEQIKVPFDPAINPGIIFR